ncbi:hypothetical protein TanjilG_07860 [Lupinus angustifolius]|uniref:Uncharacterized protein n=1 Tax=Lupinus angustifolius TaxID=3871 RepID=A0A1J7H403_LUPAN|nr:PREDICTED: uncharacterized protein LOC109327381 [Lupinus angustifolius]OIV96468.1 hypothetical protein TanjilG_07860 [Lupinus angustifolius]
MGVAVLNPQDFLQKSSSPKTSPPPNMKLPKQYRTHPKRTHSTRPESTYASNPKLNKPVMNQVKILKRGEQLTKTTPYRKPEAVSEKVVGLYAGASMLVASPPPSSVPLPVFVTKKIVAVNDATNNLRKILRLDFL